MYASANAQEVRLEWCTAINPQTAHNTNRYLYEFCVSNTWLKDPKEFMPIYHTEQKTESQTKNR